MLRTIPLLLVIILVFGALAYTQDLQIADLGECKLTNNEVIRDCHIGYRTKGKLNEAKSNAVLFLTSFRGTTEELIGFVGCDGYVDDSKYFVIFVDAFGNGVSSSPSNSGSASSPFPEVSIRDMVRHQYRLLNDELGIHSLLGVVGISMGGFQAFEWAVEYPGFAEKVIPILGSPRVAAYDIILWEMVLDIFELYKACHRQEAAQVWAGIQTLFSYSPQYHARETTREELTTVLNRMERSQLTEKDVDDQTIQLQAIIHQNVAGPYGDDIRIAAARVNSDMLVVVDQFDHVVTPGPALEFAQLVGAEILELTSDCGHMAAFSCEEERIGRAVRDFLDRTGH